MTMQDVINKKCRGPKCPIRANPKYDDYCTHCFAHLFPNDERVYQVRIKSKELQVRDFVNRHFDGFIHDKPIWTNGCNCSHKRRIDLRKMINGTLLAIEIDEHRHARYSRRDEKNRYHDIFMVHGGKMIFIRYNPDHKESDLYSLKCEIETQLERIIHQENTKLLEIIELFY